MADGKSASGRANLFHNDRKDKESHPDWKGNGEFSSEFIKALVAASVSGQPVKIDIAAWQKEGQRGMYLSCNIQVQQKKAAGPGGGPASTGPRFTPKPAPRTGEAGFDDDIPWNN